MSYDFAKTVPMDDPDMITFMEFKSLFGEDGNLIAIGVKDSSLYDVHNFELFRRLSDSIKTFTGVNEVYSLPQIQRFEKDTAERKFNLVPIFRNGHYIYPLLFEYPDGNQRTHTAHSARP